jgi:hypothetical protein
VVEILGECPQRQKKQGFNIHIPVTLHRSAEKVLESLSELNCNCNNIQTFAHVALKRIVKSILKYQLFRGAMVRKAV